MKNSFMCSACVLVKYFLISKYKFFLFIALCFYVMPSTSFAAEKTAVQGLTGYLKLGHPVSGAVKDDPLEKVVLSPITGKVVYTFDVLNKNTLQHGLPIYIVIRDLRKGNASDGIITFPLIRNFPKGSDSDTNYFVAFDPQFSPNGEYVLFKFGNPDTNGTYELYVLDTKTNVVSLVANRPLSYRKVLWSSDGNYLSYVSGGDAEGHVNLGTLYWGPLKLYICNWRTGEESLIATNDTIRGSFSWADTHTLLYGMLEESALKGKVRRPNIYQYPTEQGKSELLFHDGYYPTVSPDSKSIAFFGSEDVTKTFPLSAFWLEKPGDAALSISARDGSQRQALNLEIEEYPYVIWRDNSNLFTIQKIVPGFDIQQKITLWNIETKKYRVIATLKTKEIKNGVTEFLPTPSMQFIHDPNVLYIIGTGILGRQVGNKNGYYMTRKDMLFAINAQSGSLSPIISLNHDWGIDFYLYPSTEGE